MYRKRKKLVTPQASSTLLGNSSSSHSPISNTESDVSSQKVQSQKDLFDSESISTIVSGNTRQKLQSNDFMFLLKDAGFTLCEDGEHNVLKTDQAIFVRDLTKLLKNGSENLVNSFIKYLEEYLANKDLFKKSLIRTKAAMKLGGESSNKAKPKSSITLNRALQSAINYLETISKYMVDLNSAVNLVNLTNTLNSLQDEVENKKVTDIGELCNQFLKRKWYDNKGVELKGNQLNKSQAGLLEIYLISGEDSLENIFIVITSISNEIKTLNNSDSSFTLLPHFNKTNLHVLIKSLTKCLYTVSKNKIDVSDLKEEFTFWDKIVNCLQQLVQIVKSQDAKVNLRQLLKDSPDTDSEGSNSPLVDDMLVDDVGGNDGEQDGEEEEDENDDGNVSDGTSVTDTSSSSEAY